MSASKFALHGIGTALFRAPRTFSANPPPLLFRKPTPLKTLRLQRCSYSAAVDTVTADDNNETLSCVDQPLHHPWPEWVSFVDRLKIKGYLTESSASSSVEGGDEFDASTGGAGVANSSDSVYRNMNLVKNGCLSFARDRYDVFKSLSEEDIQTVVKAGCPNILRKVVNSAKRLRAHVGLDEGDVCSTCNLRGSCDRAYVILKGPEAAGRTVDIVRILLHHALDHLVISGGEKPPGREDIELSARKLLSELIELSESSIAPAPPKLPTKHAPIKDQSPASMADISSKDVDGRPGDWTCPKCNFFNFSRNIRCLKCNTQDLKRVSTNAVERKHNAVERKKGDWDCPKCSFVNFSRNKRCLKCNTEGPKRVSADEVEKKKGDWDCPSCGFLNFASNTKCLRCPEPRPQGRIGDWNCPKCDFFNFGKNKTCLKCNHQRPLEQPSAEDEDHEWRRPT
ncbi:zinc finger protein VAR3, chloroplastic [Neltuma alba]|uniref:zinc finger protein VAR3, chloroplastic n=1 Tax=Neltuma alba TaxID=207710 RepID=UPI0010A53021|nr:zinc finger protein VAR3, chloroplastic-like [Prosopis alba]